MSTTLQFTDDLRQQALNIYEVWEDDALVQSRQRRNVDGDRPEVSSEEFG
jgi:hypothetical protein